MSLPPHDDGGAGDDDPDSTPGGPPHPMDRIWRHPSELPAVSEGSSAPGAAATDRAGRTRMRSILVPLGAGALGALLTVAVLGAAGAFDNGSPVAATQSTGPTRVSDAIVSAAKRVAPAIVAVRVTGSRGSRSGSGVCVRHAGQVLTSYRLVAGSSRVDVVTADSSVRRARVIGRDPASDLALLAIDGALDAADLAAPHSLRIGDPVYAVGADSTGRPWVSSGIVSSLDGRVASDGTTMSGLIESNALTDPRVAGGALLDPQGRVVGILMTSVSGHPTTIAVPILLASQVADGLRAYGHVDHGWLGLAGRVSHGRLVITTLAADGPSKRAGIRVGDVVVNADSQPIASMDDLMAEARGHWPGEGIELDVTRKQRDLTVLVKLSRIPSAPVPTTTITTSATSTSAP